MVVKGPPRGAKTHLKASAADAIGPPEYAEEYHSLAAARASEAAMGARLPAAEGSEQQLFVDAPTVLEPPPPQPVPSHSDS